MEEAPGAGEEHDEMHAPEEKAQPQGAIHTLATPSAEELAEHCDNGLIPHSDWCPDCVETFGRERAHKGTDFLHQRLVPQISCDYLFITQKGVFSRNELPEEERDGALAVLVLYCSATRSIFAHAVHSKGLDPQDIRWMR